MYKRAEYLTISKRIKEPRKFIQVVMGPRQVGKSTVVKQVLLLGSSRVLLEKGLSESLGGRFEEIRMTHCYF